MNEKGSADVTTLSVLHLNVQKHISIQNIPENTDPCCARQMRSTATMVCKGLYVTPRTCTVVSNKRRR